MKKEVSKIIVLLFFSHLLSAQEKNCGTMIVSEQLLKTVVQKVNKSNIQNIAARQASIQGVVTIPVVVHVVHNTVDLSIGGSTNPNISDQQIETQLQVLNEDYRKQYNTLGFNTDSNGADTEIEFCLAATDPNGNSTSGITRHYDATLTFDISNQYAFKKYGRWPEDQYLNIWVVRALTSSQGALVGFATFPNFSNLEGSYSIETPDSLDGITIKHNVFGREVGTINVGGKLNYGRTTTHEIGHWLGLFHPANSRENVSNCYSDFCDDTPPVFNLTQTNVACNSNNVFNCGGNTKRIMMENYMDYSADACMNIFTNDQKARMRQTLTTSPKRISLLQNAANVQCHAIVYSENKLIPNSEKFVAVYNDFYNPIAIQTNTNLNTDVQIEIISIEGKLIDQFMSINNTDVNNKIYLSNLPANGLYLIKIKYSNKVEVIKVFKGN